MGLTKIKITNKATGTQEVLAVKNYHDDGFNFSIWFPSNVCSAYSKFSYKIEIM